MNKYNTFEIYKCLDCKTTMALPKHLSKDILPEGHVWKRTIKKEKEEGKIKDPLEDDFYNSSST